MAIRSRPYYGPYVSCLVAWTSLLKALSTFGGFVVEDERLSQGIICWEQEPTEGLKLRLYWKEMNILWPYNGSPPEYTAAPLHPIRLQTSALSFPQLLPSYGYRMLLAVFPYSSGTHSGL